jgi:NTE family protein
LANIRYRLGLSLSGGGYRATAFHLGTLNKLQEMHILQQADVISTISGGSITGAYYCLKKDNYDNFKESLYSAVQKKDVVKKVLLSFTFFKLVLFALLFLAPAFYFLFTPYAWLFPLLFAVFIFLLLKFQFHIFPVSKRIEKIYDDFFYLKKKLGDLPEHPSLVIGSTNLQTSKPFTFSKNWMQDSTYQYMVPPVKFKAADFPIARAVMASSCVPFAFTPVKIRKDYFRNAEDAKRVHPLLVDGGVYDNQGIHKIMQHGSYECAHIITSDAGGGSSGEVSFRNTISLLITTVDVFMSRIKKIQMIQDIYENAATTKKQIAYFSLAWDIENCIPGFINNLADKQITQSVIDAHQLKQEWVDNPTQFETVITDYLKYKTGYNAIDKPTPEERGIARKVGTNLTALSKQQTDCLIKQAACLTELQVKLYCPSLINKTP